MKKNHFALIVLLGLALWGVFDYQMRNDQIGGENDRDQMVNVQEGIKIGNRAPDFELPALESKKVKLSDFKGKKVLLNFWATWCPPCRMEMPHMERFYEDFREKDVVVIAVNVSTTEKSVDDVPKFVKQFELSFPVVLDEKGDVSETYQVIAYPTSYIIDSQGVIRHKFQGAINYDMMNQSFSNLK